MPLYQQLSNLQDQLLDELVALSAQLCRVPIAFISLLEAETVWFKHTTGWAGAARLPLGSTLCSVVIRAQTPIIFHDLRKEPCRHINSTEVNALGLQFYVGVPLRTAQGKTFGVLAILDQQPRQPQPGDRPLLEHFATLIRVLLDLYAAPQQHKLPWLPNDNQLYDSIIESMSWMHTLAKQAEAVVPAQATTHLDYQKAIGQEAAKLAGFLQQHMATLA